MRIVKQKKTLDFAKKEHPASWKCNVNAGYSKNVTLSKMTRRRESEKSYELSVQGLISMFNYYSYNYSFEIDEKCAPFSIAKGFQASNLRLFFFVFMFKDLHALEESSDSCYKKQDLFFKQPGLKAS